LLVPERAGVPWVNYNPYAWGDWGEVHVALVVQVILMIVALVGVAWILGWVAYAIVTGRDLKQRLTDPAPIDNVVETT
jgi:hypothetical protein